MPRRPLEEHVLEEVRHPGRAGHFVASADLVPDPERDDGGVPRLERVHHEPVIEAARRGCVGQRGDTKSLGVLAEQCRGHGANHYGAREQGNLVTAGSRGRALRVCGRRAPADVQRLLRRPARLHSVRSGRIRRLPAWGKTTVIENGIAIAALIAALWITTRGSTGPAVWA